MLSTLTSKSQITLPKEVRLILQLQPGDKVAFLPTSDGRVTVSKVNKPSFAKLRGLLPQPDQSHTIQEMNLAIHEAAAQRDGHRAGT